MTDLAEHPLELRALVALHAAADAAEPERAQRAAVARGLADLAADLRDPDLAHQAFCSSSSLEAASCSRAVSAASPAASTAGSTLPGSSSATAGSAMAAACGSAAGSAVASACGSGAGAGSGCGSAATSVSA